MQKPNIDSISNISAYDYYRFYMRNSRLFGLVWYILSVCFTLCLILVFVSPDWIGDSLTSPNRGYFGLYKFCTRNQLINYFECSGTWTNFNTLPNSPAIKASCFFIGFSCLISLICLVFSLFCFLIKHERIFHICAWIQLIITIFLFIGITIYPVGWNTSIIRSVCGQEADQFRIGTCTIRWPYILACMSLCQIFILTMFSFLLAARQAKFLLIYASANRIEPSTNSSNQIVQQTFIP